MPSVSTTHVSVGTLFALRTATRKAPWRGIGRIVLAWGATLPAAAALGAALSLLAGRTIR